MTKIKDALAKWEEKNAMSAVSSKEIKLCGLIPPIEKMDATLGQLITILSLGRNNIKAFAGLEAVGDTLEELWISNNMIEKTKGIGSLKKLRVLYMANNNVRDMSELNKLGELQNLEELVFVGNPLEETLSAQETYRDVISKLIPSLKKLDGFVLLRE
ncbi:hypothetical protein C0Q70_17236 [Pomacea canaliculata]|uniref:Dynein light chain 1, axonemal n=1 Tax=Pomacea canaliculata TaxID=400727 RepID=A0A2T7NS13_POMCA|nr:hypothetical protein C0Q70_17236 [Pomacea canaliculata]